jgi:hypothetical protein
LKRILIISTSYDEQSKIEEVAQYHNPGGLVLETTASFAQDITFWTTQAPDVLILHLPDDSLIQGFFFTKLRKDVPPSQPVVFLCSTISAAVMQLSQQFSKVRMLKMPADGFALYRAVNDLLQKFKEGQKQIHPRYLTEQSVEVSSDHKIGKLAGQMKNLSLSGAYFESDGVDLVLESDDLVKLSILIGEPAKQYVFDVRIVWVKPQSSGSTGYGVTFVDKEEVYNNLLKNV